ncbi:MAG: SpoIIE family protein phosphatase [bacterium]
MTVKILVVDDEPDLEALIRQKFRRQIRDNELMFVFAHNGIEALQAIEQEKDIELVLTDINMPEMDGLTLLLKLSELKRLLKAIVVSAYGDLDNIRTAMNRGAFDFLTKPIDFRDLEITIQKTLEQICMLKQAVNDHDKLLAIHRELDIAREIQMSIVPSEFPPFPGRTELDIYAMMIAAQQVGGDFYDFFFIDEKRLGFVIADVSGKGIPAALFMAVSRTLLKTMALKQQPPAECLYTVNHMLCGDNAPEMFVTLFYGILNVETGGLEFCNGGHNYPYILRAGGGVEMVRSRGGMALGIFDDMPYVNGAETLRPGDSFFLYTDGVTEAQNVAGEFYGDPRLAEILAGLSDGNAQNIIDTVVNDARKYAGEAPQSDDITALAIKYAGSGNEPVAKLS